MKQYFILIAVIIYKCKWLELQILEFKRKLFYKKFSDLMYNYKQKLEKD